MFKEYVNMSKYHLLIIDTSTKWQWVKSHSKGVEYMFTKEIFTIKVYPYIQRDCLYKGLGWDNLYHSWLNKLEEVNKSCEQHNFSKKISEWLRWIRNNNIFHEREIFERHFQFLNLQSLETLHKVVKRYEEQYEILIEDCLDYDEFKTVIDFMQDYPYHILETINDLESKQKPDLLIATYNINFETTANLNSDNKGKEVYNVECVGIKPTHSFF